MEYGEMELERAAAEGMLSPRERRKSSDMRAAYDRLISISNEYGISDSVLRELHVNPRGLRLLVLEGFKIEYPRERLDGASFENYAYEQLSVWKDAAEEHKQYQNESARMEGKE